MVAPREVRGSLRLSLLGRRAEGVQRNGRRRPPARQEGVPLYQQPFLREIGRQRRDDQAAARRTDRRRLSAGIRRAVPRAGRRREGRPAGGYSFTNIRLITSPT